MLSENSKVPHHKSGEGQNAYLQQQKKYHREQQAKPVQNPHIHMTQKPVSGSPKRQLKENAGTGQTTVRDKRKPVDNNDNNTELLKNEVGKLLEGFLEKVA